MFFRDNQTKMYMDLYKTLYAEMYTETRIQFTQFQINANYSHLSVHTTQRIVELNYLLTLEQHALEKVKAKIDFLRRELPNKISSTFAITYPIEAKFIQDTLAKKDQQVMRQIADEFNSAKRI